MRLKFTRAVRLGYALAFLGLGLAMIGFASQFFRAPDEEPDALLDDALAGVESQARHALQPGMTDVELTRRKEWKLST